jgi:ribosomal-protein-alanine N-acetyltransferase
MIIVETENLVFRPLTDLDLGNLSELYSDPEVMKYLGGPRGPEEVKRVLTRYIQEYQMYGHSFFATILKREQKFIGQCGLLHQEVEGEVEVELGYVLAKQYWKHGLAIEGIAALRDYGLETLGLGRLISLIPPENEASISIAEKIGMKPERDIVQWGQNFRLYAIQKSGK